MAYFVNEGNAPIAPSPVKKEGKRLKVLIVGPARWKTTEMRDVRETLEAEGHTVQTLKDDGLLKEEELLEAAKNCDFVLCDLPLVKARKLATSQKDLQIGFVVNISLYDVDIPEFIARHT